MKDKHKFVTRFLFIMSWNFSVVSSGISVDPPADLHITDLGRLGELQIGWTFPSSLENLTSCSMRFQLQYLNTYEDRWMMVRTTRQWYRAQFNLEKDVHVKVWTLLKGPCTNNTEIQSSPVELLLQPPSEGIGPQVTGFDCVFHQKEYMECTWQERTPQPPRAQNYLFFWHKNMEEVKECPKYMLSNGIRTGCHFPLDVLLEFSDFNILVNGSCVDGPLKPAYYTLQIQNHVKPSVIKTLHLETQSGRNVAVEWSPSEKRISASCLEYEVESRQEDVLGETLEYYTTGETTYTTTVSGQGRGGCFRVRSRLNQFCADSSFWSAWSPSRCLPEHESLMKTLLPCMLAVAVITFLVAVLLLWTCRKTLKKERWLLAAEWFPKGVFGSPHRMHPCSTEKLPSHLCSAEIQPIQQGQLV